jgi:hypothetical protein
MRSLLLATLLLSFTPAAFAQNDEADKKTLKRILEEIALVPSLYAKDDPALRPKKLPKFSSVKLVSYPIGKINTADKERENWRKDKEQYSKEFPHRAAIFEAAAIIEKVNAGMTIDAPLDPKQKAMFLLAQEPVGRQIFQLEEILAKMNEADRDKEKMRRWLLDADFARARLLGNLAFLYEYSFTLGQIRADNLPELGKGADGWKIGIMPKINVTEPRAKQYVKERAKLLQKIQDDHGGTPWAYFAERDSKRELGMAWVARKK